ncbi:MAG: glycoside hydrolase family 97 catalytic domain-containing protein [Prolixibacteraceae bacterium]|nr:glycoside hydrolase family 97 catalytic domain-containing protein [Prolixibacteraceae bacterium]
MKKINLFSLVLLFTSSLLTAAQHQLNSPEGSLQLKMEVNNGIPSYSVNYNNKVLLLPSPLGLQTNVGDFTSDLTLADQFTQSSENVSYMLPNIKQSKVSKAYNEAVFSFLKNDKPAFDLIVRLSNNDVAFRYLVHPQGERKSCVVEQEATGFVLPEGSTSFLSPQMLPMTGFARTGPSYETPYTADDAMGKNGWGVGYIFPALFRVIDRGWVLISETGVDSRYCGSRLIGHENGRYSLGFPQEGENNGNGTVSPGIPLPGYTPWRTITVGDNLKPIVETTVAFDHVEPLYEASQKYEYTRGTWSWIIKMDGNTIFPVQKEYIDLSAAMGWETVLVDALWDTQIGRDKIEELAAYGKTKNVDLFLWYNSNGYWNDAPQGPHGLMDTPMARRKEMAWMKSIGIRGIKVDFFGGDKQVTMKLYEDILYDANDFGLLVVFHGCTLPRGWERMFPNYGSSEAVLASEMLHFSQERCNTEAFHASMHPFVRNTVGSMDFGGSVLNKFWNGNNTPGRGTKRLTSDVFQLAIAVLFQSPVQHFALAPNNLTDAPAWAINFMKAVPTTWDEIRYIDGYPGKYVVMARRKDKQWYLAAVNAQKETLTLKVSVDMFNAGEQVVVYSDDAQLNGSVKSININDAQQLELNIPSNGGVLITRLAE